MFGNHIKASCLGKGGMCVCVGGGGGGAVEAAVKEAKNCQPSLVSRSLVLDKSCTTMHKRFALFCLYTLFTWLNLTS